MKKKEANKDFSAKREFSADIDFKIPVNLPEA